MIIFTATIESWTVPGAHVKSFAKREEAETWLREQFAEYLLHDLCEEMEDQYSGIYDEAGPEFFGSADRVVNGTASLDDYAVTVALVNEVKDWSGAIHILESELAYPVDEMRATLERIASISNQAGLAALLLSRIAAKKVLAAADGTTFNEEDA